MDENIRLEYCPLCGELVSHYECGCMDEKYSPVCGTIFECNCLPPNEWSDTTFIEPEGE